MKHRNYSVYIVTNTTRQLYTGFTSNLEKQVKQHKQKEFDDGFPTHWHECRFVHFEGYDNANRAIGREKQIKRWRREKKIWLIESINPDWHDLSSEWGKPIKAAALSLDYARQNTGAPLGMTAVKR